MLPIFPTKHLAKRYPFISGSWGTNWRLRQQAVWKGIKSLWLKPYLWGLENTDYLLYTPQYRLIEINFPYKITPSERRAFCFIAFNPLLKGWNKSRPENNRFTAIWTMWEIHINTAPRPAPESIDNS